jgi:hypothetical protein
MERTLDGAEVGHHHLTVVDRAVEECLSNQRVGTGVLKQAASRQRRAPDAGAREQLAPAVRRFRIRDIDNLRVERDPAAAQSRHRDEARAVAHLQKQVLAFLCAHDASLNR